MTLFAASGGEVSEWRTRIEGNRVACRRIGSVELDRCRECLYFIRLVDGTTPEMRPAYVVCADADLDADADFAW